MSHRFPTEPFDPVSEVRKPRGSFVKTELWYMWVVVFLTACDALASHTVTWSFVDHRSCADANVTTIVVRSDAREIARVECSAGAVNVERVDDDRVVVEAETYAGTVLYRGHLPADASRVTLRFVGGRPP